MAKVQYGAIVTGVRGTIGGATFSQNHSGPYARIWSRGRNPRTTLQENNRAYFAQLPAAWQGMSQANRDDWDTFAALGTSEKTDPFGDPYYASGWNWFCEINLRRPLFGESVYTGTPVTTATGAPPASTVTIDPSGGGTYEVTIDAGYWGSGIHGIFYCRPGPGPGRLAPTGALKYMIGWTNTTSSPQDFQSAYETAYGPAISGQRVFWSLSRGRNTGYQIVPQTGYVDVP